MAFHLNTDCVCYYHPLPGRVEENSGQRRIFFGGVRQYRTLACQSIISEESFHGRRGSKLTRAQAEQYAQTIEKHAPKGILDHVKSSVIPERNRPIYLVSPGNGPVRVL